MPQKLRCEVTKILDHGERVYSVLLKPETPAPRFLPGQFLHLALDEYIPGYFWPDSRSFSIASAATDQQSLRITYAVKGQFTHRMEAELYPGKEVWVKMPYGEFRVNTDSDACLLAGGTGITAFTAFLAGLPAEYPNKIYLFYGARHPELLIYRSMVEAAKANCPNLHTFFLIETGTAPGCFFGRLEPDFIWMNVVDPMAISFYLSGPPGMTLSLSKELTMQGIPAEHIFVDAWE